MLPKLEELTVYYPEERMSAYYTQRPETHAAIREIVVPASESEHFGFDIVFQEARYQLVAPGFLEDDDDQRSSDGTVARGWRFVDINTEVVFCKNTLYFIGKCISHSHAASVDANTIQYGVWPSEVYVFKDVWSKLSRRGDLAARDVVPCYDDGFAWGDIQYLSIERNDTN